MSINDAGELLGSTVLDAGIHALSIQGNNENDAGDWGSWNGFEAQTRSIGTPAVPLPAGFPLILTALGALGIAGRRKAKRG